MNEKEKMSHIESHINRKSSKMTIKRNEEVKSLHDKQISKNMSPTSKTKIDRGKINQRDYSNKQSHDNEIKTGLLLSGEKERTKRKQHKLANKQLPDTQVTNVPSLTEKKKYIPQKRKSEDINKQFHAIPITKTPKLSSDGQKRKENRKQSGKKLSDAQTIRIFSSSSETNKHKSKRNESKTMNEQKQENLAKYRRRKSSMINRKKKSGFAEKFRAIIGIVLLVLILIIILLVVVLRTPKICKEIRRLPNHIIPEHYDLEINTMKIDDKSKFQGKVKIIVQCREKTNIITLNQKDLIIDGESIIIQDQIGSVIKLFNLKTDQSFLMITFEKYLKQHKNYTLIIHFSGYVNNILELGFFKSKQYKNLFIATNFQKDLARTAFPCFDEPSFKATFNITIIRKKKYVSISNMPLDKTEVKDSETEMDTFQKTPPIASHSVIIVVAEMEHKKEKKITFWFRKQVKRSLYLFRKRIQNVLMNAERLLGNLTFHNLNVIILNLNTEHPIIGAGTIIFCERSAVIQFYDIALKDMETTEKIVYSIIIQWLGQSVTMNRWIDSWLTEGLTQYLMMDILTNIYDIYSRINRMYIIVYDEEYMFCHSDEDGSLSLFHLKCKINSSDELFHQLSHHFYSSSLNIFHALRYVIGYENFHTTLKIFLKENSFSSIDLFEFWKHFNMFTSKDDKIALEEHFQSWLNLPGKPIVTATRDYEAKTVNLTQKSCKVLANRKYKKDFWHIPISFITKKTIKSEMKVVTWMTDTNTKLYNMPNEDEWILINEEQMGNYIINYDSHNWHLLAKELHKNSLIYSLEQKYKLITDMLYLENLGETTLQYPMDLYLFLPNESLQIFYPIFKTSPHYLNPWDLTLLLEGSEVQLEWTQFIWYLFGKKFSELQWIDRSYQEFHIYRDVRLLILETVCRLEISACNRIFPVFTYNKKPEILSLYVNKDVENIILCLAIRYHESNVMEFYRRNYENHYPLLLIKCSSNKTIVHQELEKLFEDDVRVTKFTDRLKYCFLNVVLWEECYNFIDYNFQYLNKRTKLIRFLINAIIDTPLNLRKHKKIVDVLNKNRLFLSNRNKKYIEEVINKYNDTENIEIIEKKISVWLKKKPWLK